MRLLRSICRTGAPSPATGSCSSSGADAPLTCAAAAHFTPVVMSAARRAGAVVAPRPGERSSDLAEDPGRASPYGLGSRARPRRLAGQARVRLLPAGRGSDAADWTITQHEGQSALCARMGLRHLLHTRHRVRSGGSRPPDEPQEHDAVWVGNVHREDYAAARGWSELVRSSRSGRAPLRFCRGRALLVRRRRRAAGEAGGAAQRDRDSAPLTHSRRRSQLIARSRVVVNTAAWEGLSNVMLEGWAAVQADRFAVRGPQRICWAAASSAAAPAATSRAMAAMLARLARDEACAPRDRARCAAYVARVHGADAVHARSTRRCSIGRTAARRGAAMRVLMLRDSFPNGGAERQLALLGGAACPRTSTVHLSGHGGRALSVPVLQASRPAGADLSERRWRFDLFPGGGSVAPGAFVATRRAAHLGMDERGCGAAGRRRLPRARRRRHHPAMRRSTRASWCRVARPCARRVSWWPTATRRRPGGPTEERGRVVLQRVRPEAAGPSRGGRGSSSPPPGSRDRSP